MKLTIKTLQQTTFKVDIELDKTVKDLKEKIEKEQGDDYPSGAQKLIYSGKILADESKLSEYEFDEKKFVVLMITRPPPAPKPAPEPATAKTKPASDDKPKPSAATTQQKTPSAPPPSSTVSSATGTSSTSTTSQSTTTTASQNTATSQDTRQSAASAARASALSDLAALSMGEPQVAARLASLMAQPHFRQIQDLIQQSPHLLSSAIESIAASDPEMYSFMSENPDVFVNALNHPPLAGSRTTTTTNSSTRSSTTASQSQSQRDRSSQQSTPRAAADQQQPGVADSVLVDVSEHDKEAIERLKELGFSEYLAVQAYMACDKDEQLAANLLFQMEQ